MKHRIFQTALIPFCCASLLGAAGCISSTEPGAESEEEVVGGTSTGGVAPAEEEEEEVASTGGTTPSGTGGSGFEDPEPLPVELYLPVTVTDSYAPAGFMGKLGLDEAGDFDPTLDEVEGIVMDEEGCTDRPEGAVGACFKVTYTPQQLAADGGTWAGVFFQSPALNWGEQPGKVIEQGATKVSFNAWSESGESVAVEFLSGGLGDLGTAYADTFSSKSGKVTLADSVAASGQEISLAGQPYEMVLGGFGWVIETDSLDPIVFYIDNVVWDK